MKARKRILATLLSVAVAVTTVLPGAVTANAAVIVTETPGQNVETGTWSETMDVKNVGGEFYWRLKSGPNNDNVNDDYSREGAPAVILDYSQDLTVVEGEEPSTINVDIYPNGTASKLRFGIMVKYVDPTHWAWINYDVGSWIFQYQCDDLTNKWPAIPEFANSALQDNQNVNVKVTYTAADQLNLSLQASGGEEKTAVINDENYDNILSLLEEYAATAGENGEALPIRYGFKAGTYQGTTITDINLKNMALNGEDMMSDNWGWVVEREGQEFIPDDVVGGTNYYVLNGKTSTYTSLEDFANGTVSAVLRPAAANAKFALAARHTASGAVQVGYDGSKWYYTVGSQKTQVNAGPAVTEDTDYRVAMAINDGKLNATVALAEEGAQEYAVANSVDVSGVAAGTIAVAAEAGSEVWVRDVNYNHVVKSEPTELIGSYNQAMSDIGGTNTDNKYYSNTWEEYATALAEAKAMIESDDEITQAQATAKKTALDRAVTRLELVDKTTLEARYNELKDTPNANYTEDSWSTFQDALTSANEVLKKIDAKQSVSKTEVTSAATALTNAANRLREKMATEEDIAALTSLYNEIKAMDAASYTADSWAAADLALKGAEDVMALGTDATQLAVQDAVKALQAAKEGLKLAHTVSFVNTAYTVEATAAVPTKVTANTTVTYASSDPSVATVDANGVVTGVKAGTAVITATAGTVNATATVTVTTPAVALNAKSAKLQLKKSTTAIKVASKIDTDSVVSWTSSKPSVASVNNAGKITAKKTGKTVITVTMKSGATASCSITVQKGKVTVKSIKVNSKKVTLKKGKKFTIEVTKNPITAADKVTFSSSKKKVATVNGKGVVTAKKKGTCKITVKCGKKKTTVNVTVK